MKPKAPPAYRYIGKGAFNVSFVRVADNALFRVFTDSENEVSLEELVRGAEIQRQLALEPALTPFMLEPSGMPVRTTFGELPDDVRRYFKDAKPDIQVYTQTGEYATGGNFEPQPPGSVTSMQVRIDAFSLVWFFYVAQREYGYRHRDLKLDNIVVKEFADKHEFNVTLQYGGSVAQFNYKADWMPVVIDFDFSSLYGSNEESRGRMGSPETVPPEECHRMMYMADDDYVDHVAKDPAYDWFSLGVCLFTRWFAPPDSDSSWDVFQSQLVNHALAVRDLLTLRGKRGQTLVPMQRIVKSIVAQMCAMFAIGMAYDTMPHYYVFPQLREYADTTLFTDEALVEIRNTLPYVDMYGQTSLLQRLWSVEPRNRIMDGASLRDAPLFAPLQQGRHHKYREGVEVYYEERPLLEEDKSNEKRVEEHMGLLKSYPHLKCAYCGDGIAVMANTPVMCGATAECAEVYCDQVCAGAHWKIHEHAQ